jgi:hypothetical protein
MCVPNYKKTLIKLLQKFHKQLVKKETLIVDDSCYLSHNCPSKEATSLKMASHPQFYPQASSIQTVGISLQNLFEECVLGVQTQAKPMIP